MNPSGRVRRRPGFTGKDNVFNVFLEDVDKSPNFDIHIFKIFFNNMTVNSRKYYKRCFDRLVDDPFIYGDLLKAYQILVKLNWEEESRKCKLGQINTVVCAKLFLSKKMGISRNYASDLLSDMVEFRMIRDTGRTVNIKGAEVPVYAFNDMDSIVSYPKKGRKTKKQKTNDDNMGNFIGTLEDFVIQETEPIITCTNGEHKDEVTANPVIPKETPIDKDEPKNEVATKEEPIAKEEPKAKGAEPDEPPTIKELLEPYKEYLDPKVPFDEIPRHVMDEIIKNGLENHFVYIRKGWDISGLGYPKKKS